MKLDFNALKTKFKSIKYLIILADDVNEIALTSNYKVVSYKKYTYSMMQYMDISKNKYMSKKTAKNVDALREKYLK